MKLENSYEKIVNNPSELDIRNMFEGFGENDMDDLIILSKNNMNYIQTAIGEKEDEGFILEYQDSCLDNHYIATDKDLDLNQIIEIFISYNSGDEKWKSVLQWELSLMTEEDFE